MCTYACASSLPHSLPPCLIFSTFSRWDIYLIIEYREEEFECALGEYYSGTACTACPAGTYSSSKQKVSTYWDPFETTFTATPAAPCKSVPAGCVACE